jgi:hypothetical protein
MGKQTPAAEPVPFQGLQLKHIEEIDLQQVNGAVWLFMKRRDGTIVRIWISHPDRVPLKVTVEVEDR